MLRGRTFQTTWWCNPARDSESQLPPVYVHWDNFCLSDRKTLTFQLLPQQDFTCSYRQEQRDSEQFTLTFVWHSFQNLSKEQPAESHSGCKADSGDTSHIYVIMWNTWQCEHSFLWSVIMCEESRSFHFCRKICRRMSGFRGHLKIENYVFHHPRVLNQFLCAIRLQTLITFCVRGHFFFKQFSSTPGASKHWGDMKPFKNNMLSLNRKLRH